MDLIPRLWSVANESGREQNWDNQTQNDPTRDHDSTYTYRPLHDNNIRLIILKKGNWNDHLHGTLISVPLDRKTDYEAVSYVWADENGDSTCSQPLYLGEYWAILRITKNCEAALRRFRFSEEDRFYGWMQSVSIKPMYSKGPTRLG
ncbi:hypothetical protein F4819DRAFT_28562 [Hypoxylon fuscum]|nr:hypothetical protein F4819DRAFT_28562 [Hypoxylon fuscum]